MRLLLDTDVVLWVFGLPGRLAAAPRGMIEDGRNDVFVSAASAWEIAIKRALGRLEAPDPLAEALDRRGFSRLSIDFEHARAAGALPRHHRDPIDRMLIAQAQIEGLSVVTSDRRFADYQVAVIPATQVRR